MTIKEFLNKYFEDKMSGEYFVDFKQVNYVFNLQDFYNVWDELENDIDKGGVQWALEWYMEEPTLTDKREQFIKNAISKYINTVLKPKYFN